tara:strand:- start:5859 stop:6089 length:231 start_codon:yes stop_codon:yes gene_type:complete
MKKKCNIHLKSRRNEPSERLIRRFIKKVKKEKIVEEARDRRRYKKPSVKKKDKRIKAQRERKRQEARRLRRRQRRK